jgi:hypothetical protein
MGAKQIASDGAVGAAGKRDAFDPVAAAEKVGEGARHGDAAGAAGADQGAVDVKEKNAHGEDCTEVDGLVKERRYRFSDGKKIARNAPARLRHCRARLASTNFGHGGPGK